MKLEDILNKLATKKYEQVSESTWVNKSKTKEVVLIDENNVSISTKKKGKIYHGNGVVDLEKVDKLI